MRLLLSGLFLLASSASANVLPDLTCQSDRGAVQAEYQCDSGNYLVTYDFADGAGQYEAQLLTAGSGDYTFEELYVGGGSVATFFVYQAGQGLVGEFGGKGLLPKNFTPGQCVITKTAESCE